VDLVLKVGKRKVREGWGVHKRNTAPERMPGIYYIFHKYLYKELEERKEEIHTYLA
jgi:hypothetical protein